MSNGPWTASGSVYLPVTELPVNEMTDTRLVDLRSGNTHQF